MLSRPRVHASEVPQLGRQTSPHASYSKYKKAAGVLRGAALVLLSQSIQLVLASISSHPLTEPSSTSLPSKTIYILAGCIWNLY